MTNESDSTATAGGAMSEAEKVVEPMNRVDRAHAEGRAELHRGAPPPCKRAFVAPLRLSLEHDVTETTAPAPPPAGRPHRLIDVDGRHVARAVLDDRSAAALRELIRHYNEGSDPYWSQGLPGVKFVDEPTR